MTMKCKRQIEDTMLNKINNIQIWACLHTSGIAYQIITHTISISVNLMVLMHLINQRIH